MVKEIIKKEYKVISEMSHNDHSNGFRICNTYRYNEDASIDNLIRNIGLLEEIESVYICRNGYDALIDGYAWVNGFNSIPTFIIRDIDNNELHIDNCNCGYNGEGPNNSIYILNLLCGLKSFDLPYTDTELKNAIYSEKIIHILPNGDKPADIIVRNSYFNKINMAILCFINRDGDTVISHNFNKVRSEIDNSDIVSLFTLFKTFVPSPINVYLMPLYDTAIEHGYFLNDSNIDRDVYRLIIKDLSGREIWTNPQAISIPNKVQKTLYDVFSICSFIPDLDTNTDSEILSWLNSKVEFQRSTVSS